MKKKFNGAKDWDYIIVEGFCGYSFMKDKYVTAIEMIFKKDKNGKTYHSDGKSEKIKSSTYVNAKIPPYCKKHVGVECLGSREKKCPFFLCAQAEYDEYLIRYIKEMRKYSRRNK